MTFYQSKITKNIFKNCDNFGNKIMLEDISGKKISGIEYKNLAIFYAEKLQKKGIKSGDSIVVFIKDIINFSAYALATLLVGAKLVIIEPDYSEEILKEKLDFIKPDLLIVEGFLYYLLKTLIIKNISIIKKYKSLLVFSKQVIVYNKSRECRPAFPTELVKINNKSEALIVFTGGTTGKPKGVVHTLKTLEIMFERIEKIIGKETKIFYADLPHFVLMGINIGVKIIVGRNEILDKKFLKILEKYKIDTTFSPPYRYNNLITHPSPLLDKRGDRLPKTLKHILLGSAPIYKSFLEKLYSKIEKDSRVTCIYGMTEILPVSSVDGREKLEKNIDGDLLGKPLDGIKFELDKDNELILSGDGIYNNYLGEKKCKKHKTGDIIKIIDGNLVMKSRKKDMILRRDYNIYPSLYEDRINKIKGIKNSAMVGIFDEKLQDEKIILFLENSKYLKPGIRKKLEKIIDKFALPDEIIFLDEIPVIGRQNKIDKNYLRNNYKNLGK